MSFRSAAKLALMLVAAAIVGGCAVGRTYNYAETPIALQGTSSAGIVAVGVEDERPYVLSGNKPERFVGLMRGGFGNPFDVNTKSGRPFAEELRDAIVRAMKARGIQAVPVAIPVRDTPAAATQRLVATKARRSVLVMVREWKSDTMMATDLHYDLTLAVLDAGGNRLAESTLRGMDNLGSLGLSPDEGISRASARKIDMLFEDAKVAAALK